MDFLQSIPWHALEGLFLLAVGLLLALVAWRLYGATQRYIEMTEKMAEIIKTQKEIIKEQKDATKEYVKSGQDLVNLEQLKFLDQLEFFYRNKPDEIKPRSGLDNIQAEESFLSKLIESRVKLSIKAFDDIVRSAMTRPKY